MTTKLSFNKLLTLLENKSYTLVAAYTSLSGGHEETRNVVFLEVRTPKVQKTFFIYISPKYYMPCTEETDHYKNTKITEMNNLYSTSDVQTQAPEVQKNTEYIAEIKGPLLQCDLLSVSSSLLCLYKNNGDSVIFKFGDLEREEVEDLVDLEEKGDAVDKLVRSAKKITKKMGEVYEEPDLNDSTATNEGAKDDSIIGRGDEAKGEDIEEQIDEAKEEEGEAKGGASDPESVIVELEFKDEKGNVVGEEILVSDEDLSEAKGEAKEEEDILALGDDSTEKKKGEDKIKPDDGKKDKLRIHKGKRCDNSLPDNIEDSDITLGIIYYSIDVVSFNKKLSVVPKPNPVADITKADATKIEATVKEQFIPLEDEIINIYDAIDDNENEARLAKLDEVVELSAKLTIKAKDEIDACKLEELNLKAQILKLSGILDQCEKLRAKVGGSETKKFIETKPEIERLYKQTKITLYEINIEIMRNKDKANEILSRYQTSLEELLNN